MIGQSFPTVRSYGSGLHLSYLSQPGCGIEMTFHFRCNVFATCIAHCDVETKEKRVTKVHRRLEEKLWKMISEKSES